MRRDLSQIISIASLSIFFSGANVRAMAQEELQKRTVTVCVLNDTTAQFSSGSKTIPLPHIPREKIEKIISDASIDYDANTGVTFKIEEYHEMQINTQPAPVFQTAQLRFSCPLGEVVAVFTNQPMAMLSDPLPFPGWPKSLRFSRRYDGWSNREYGIAWVFSVAFWDPQKAGSSPMKTFEHEVGHLFGLEHSPGPGDFMYDKGMSDDWSNRISEGIKKNIGVHWKMKA